MENRSKKILISAIIIVAFLIIGAVVFYFLLKSEGTTPGDETTSYPGDGTIFPGGGDAPGGGTGGRGGVPASGGTTGTVKPSTSRIPSGLSFRPILRRISATPVSGAITYYKTDKAYTRYIERAKGNTLETEADNVLPVRLTNTTVPQVYSALFSKNAENVVLQYLKENVVQTFSASVIQKGGGQGELRGKFMDGNITNLALSPTGDRASYTVKSGNSGTAIIASLTTSSKSKIFDSPLTEWIINWPKIDIVTLTSKAGYNTEGLMKSVNVSTGEESVLLSGVTGLTTLMSGDGLKILYSRSTDGSLDTRLFDIEKAKNGTFTLDTLPEKCVWSSISKKVVYCAVPESIPTGNYPDDWYLGVIGFTDEIWKIDTTTGETFYMASLGSESKMPFDAINLSLDDKERFITLMNKEDLSLWTLQIAQ